MSEWLQATDPRSGKIYYYNKRTKKTQWTKPAEMEGGDGGQAQEAPAAAAAAASPVQEDLDANPAYWAEGFDSKSGKTYYYNKKTKRTSWNKPACMGGAPAPAAAAAPVKVVQEEAPVEEAPKKKNVWLKAVDPRSGKPYWYNKATKETTWKNPEEEEAAPAAAPAAAAAASVASSSAPSIALGGAGGGGRGGPARDDSDDEDDGGAILGPGQQAAQQEQHQDEDDGGALEVEDDVDDDDGPPAKGGGAKKPAKDDAGGESDEEPDQPLGQDKALQQKMHHHDREVADIESKQGDEDEEDDGSHEFHFAKHRKGWFNRTFRVGAVADDATILSFKKSLIKKALLKRNRHLDNEAIQCFKNVMSYMGDRKSSKGQIPHAKKMLRNLMLAPVGLRDELYMQLIKQTTGNPKPSSTIKGWELMTFCLATFPPSKQLKNFLSDFVGKTVRDSPIDEVKKLAKVSQGHINTIVAMGQRKQVPSKLELECLKAMKLIPIRVNLVDDTFKTFMVEPYTTNKEVEDMLIQKYNLVVSSPFALYEGAEEKNVERILDPKDRCLDVLASWENDPVVDEVKVDPRVKKSKTKHKDQAKQVKAKEIKYCKFIYKAKLVLKTSNKEIMSDPEAINLIYIQATQDVVSERYPAKTEDITVLAALQLQATFGDYKKDVHFPGWLRPKLEQFMPASLFTKKGKKSEKLLKEWEQMILTKYAKVSGFTSLEAKLNYLDYVQEWTFYGSTFFMVEQRQFKDYPSPLVLGINCEGVLLMHPEKKTVLENYGFTDIVTWGHSDEKFIIVVGNIVQQRKLIFKTENGQEMNHLIHDYVKFKVKNKAP